MGQPLIEHVTLEADALQRLGEEGTIPREDVSIFLTALAGGAECFVSANYKLIKAMAATAQIFECLTAAEFAARYIAGNS